MDNIIEVLQKIADFAISPVILGGVAVVVELVLRLVKSDKPLGIIHSASAIVRKVAKMVELVAAVIQKVADVTDKVLPQNTTTKQ